MSPTREDGQPVLRLRPLAVTDEREAWQAHDELTRDDFEFLLGLRPGESWARYVERTNSAPLGLGLPAGWVQATFLVAEVDHSIVGRISIRHHLGSAYLAEFGGHIGYAVRPGFRGRGYATTMLRQGLDVARGLGIEDVLLTCDVGNAASAVVIERCGGVLEGVVSDPSSGAKRRYWIRSTARAAAAPE